MKKLAVGLLTGALALTLGGTALAAGHGCGWRQTGRGADCPWCGAGCAYTDADGNGICDHYTGGGDYYVDADGDGVCDYRAAGGHHGGGHHGWGRGCRN